MFFKNQNFIEIHTGIESDYAKMYFGFLTVTFPSQPMIYTTIRAITSHTATCIISTTMTARGVAVMPIEMIGTYCNETKYETFNHLQTV